jgi:hypothetical protein
MLRHNDDIIACFYPSNKLFMRLEHGLEQFKGWIVLGQVNIEELVGKIFNRCCRLGKKF